MPDRARQLDLRQPVWVDADATRVYVDGHVTLREGVLEMFACPKGTKEHESIVAVDAPAMLIHTALLAVGAEPGTPVQFQPDYRPPTGTEIAVGIEWMANDAKQTAKAQDWVRNAETGRAMDLPFVFAGSGFWTDPDTKQNHYLAEGGDLICVSNFGAAMLDVPAPSTQANDELWFEPFTERIPEVGTPVRLVLTPVSREAAAPANAGSLDDAIQTIRGVEVGVGSTEAVQSAWQRLAAAPVDELPRLLDAMKDASPLAENWLRSAIDAVADSVGEAAALEDTLRQFIRNMSHAPRARRTAYEILRRYRPKVADAVLSESSNDPSLEMRYDAVAKLLQEAEGATGDDQVDRLREALNSARSLDQVEKIEKRLEELGEPVDLKRQLGFVTAWKVIGPFDNRGGVGFDEAYPPEAKLDLEAEYSGHDEEGPRGPFGWKDFATEDRLGEVELNDALGTHKGAVGYAWAVLESDERQPIEVRLQSVCATKV
ncbi:MAG: YdjY domain-containing protein, partial [Planctomycetota bacterium]